MQREFSDCFTLGFLALEWLSGCRPVFRLIAFAFKVFNWREVYECCRFCCVSRRLSWRNVFKFVSVSFKGALWLNDTFISTAHNGLLVNLYCFGDYAGNVLFTSRQALPYRAWIISCQCFDRRSGWAGYTGPFLMKVNNGSNLWCVFVGRHGNRGILSFNKKQTPQRYISTWLAFYSCFNLRTLKLLSSFLLFSFLSAWWISSFWLHLLFFFCLPWLD